MTATGTIGKNISEQIADAQTDSPIAGTVDVSALKSLYIKADQDCTLETNSGSAPDAIIALKANKALVWESSDGYYTNPLGVTDVASWFLTNASGSAVNIEIHTLEDATP